MNSDQSKSFRSADPAAVSGWASEPSVLTVALPMGVRDTLPRHVLAPTAKVRHIAMGEVALAALTGKCSPALVLSPLFAPGFDAVDLLMHLKDAAFRGRYLILAPSMPDIPLIRAEMLAQAGDVEVDIICLSDASALHLV